MLLPGLREPVRGCSYSKSRNWCHSASKAWRRAVVRRNKEKGLAREVGLGPQIGPPLRGHTGMRNLEGKEVVCLPCTQLFTYLLPPSARGTQHLDSQGFVSSSQQL